MPNVGRLPDNLIEEKERMIAFNYVNIYPGNKRAAYRKYYTDTDKEPPKDVTINHIAYEFFKRPRVQEWVEHYREENRKDYAHIRELNISLLLEMATDEKGSKRDKQAAIKELNNMCGYNTQNLNVKAESAIEITIE